MEGVGRELLWYVLEIGLCVLLIRICDVIWLKPRRIRSIIFKQGIKGPKSHFLYGNIQQMQKIQSVVKMEMITPTTQSNSISHTSWSYSIFPYLHQWAQQYGTIYLYSTGNNQHLYVGEPNLIKALNLHKSLDLGKPNYLSKAMEPMLGNGIIRANGVYWDQQRKLIAPEFFLHKAKHKLGLIEESTREMIRKWEREVESKGGVADIMVDNDLKSLSADIISKACFGSTYSQGKQIFAKLDVLQEAMSKPSILFGLTNLRFLPTKSNKQIWRLQKEIKSLILGLVKGRREETQRSEHKSEKDLLQAIIESADSSEELQHSGNADRFIVDNCKNIYFAGHDTTSLAASWILMLLSLHSEWQDRVRQEILDICGPGYLHEYSTMDLDKLRQLKTLNMVIQESLRLYGPAVITSREVFADLKVGDIIVPKGTNLWISITALHRDPENWGSDADKFKPQRFANGISEACKDPQCYIPFGFGNRLCLGQSFAMLELKILLSLVLSNFSFTISPHYRHSPVYRMLLKPEHGIRLLVRRVQRNTDQN